MRSAVARRRAGWLAAAALAGACGSGPADASEETRTVEALCRARAQADEPAAAEETFFGRAHRPLHDIARDVGERDRKVAGRLLVAKNAVETALREDAPAGLVAERLEELDAATREALQTLEVAAPDCD